MSTTRNHRVSRRNLLIGGTAALAALAVRPMPARAAKRTLRVVSLRAKTSYMSLPLTDFAERVARKTDGEIAVQFAGGPEVLTPDQAPEAVANGLFDMAQTLTSFYANAMPEAVALQSGPDTTSAALRASGAFRAYGDIMERAVGVRLLGVPINGCGYVMMSRTPIDTLADFAGKRFRSLPIYDPIFKELGAATMTVSPTEVYTALERGAVDGAAWSDIGFVEARLYEHASYIMAPPFYHARTILIGNPAMFESLGKDVQAAIEEAAAETDAWGWDMCREQRDRDYETALAGGATRLALPDDEAAHFSSMAERVLWQSIIDRSAETGKQLQDLFAEAETISKRA